MKKQLRRNGTKSACRCDYEQARKRMECGDALAVGLAGQNRMKPCGQSCRGGGP